MIDTQCETMIEEFAQRIAQSGLSMDQYLQFSGLTVDGIKGAGSSGSSYPYPEQSRIRADR